MVASCRRAFVMGVVMTALGAAPLAAEAPEGLLLQAGVKQLYRPDAPPQTLVLDPDLLRLLHRTTTGVDPALARGYLREAGVPSFYLLRCLPLLRLSYRSTLKLHLPSLPFTSRRELVLETRHDLTIRRLDDGTFHVEDESTTVRPDEPDRRPSLIKGAFRLSPWGDFLPADGEPLPPEVYNARALFVRAPEGGPTEAAWELPSGVAFPPNPLGLGIVHVTTRTRVIGFDSEPDAEGLPLLVLEHHVRNTRTEAASGRHFASHGRVVVDRRGVVVSRTTTGQIRRRLFFLLPWVAIPFDAETTLTKVSED